MKFVLRWLIRHLIWYIYASHISRLYQIDQLNISSRFDNRLFTARVAKRAKVMFSQVCITHSVHREGDVKCTMGQVTWSDGGGFVTREVGQTSTPPPGQTSPPGQTLSPPPNQTSTPLVRPGHHPLWSDLHTPPPPGSREQGNTVNVRAVRILLECILFKLKFW